MTEGEALHGESGRVSDSDAARHVGAIVAPARALARPILKLLYRVQVEGLENVPPHGPAILSPNHRSFFDSPLVMAMTPRPVAFLGKAEYMDRTTTRVLFPAVGMVPIKRDAKRASMAALETAADLLRSGRLVGIYPEGTRSRDGLLHRGHSGVAHLAMLAAAPIIPVGIVGTDRVQPIGTVVPRPFRGRVRLRFGEPIHPADYRYGGSRRKRQQMLSDVMAAIAAMTDQEVSPDFASDEPPLVRGGTESVYRVTCHRGVALSWHRAAELAVDAGCSRYDDARVGEVSALRCQVLPSGQIEFGTELKLSTRFRSAPAAADADTSPSTPGGTP